MLMKFPRHVCPFVAGVAYPTCRMLFISIAPVVSTKRWYENKTSVSGR